jgi:alpha-ketoglutarate-dependent taurine dioxygenase
MQIAEVAMNVGSVTDIDAIRQSLADHGWYWMNNLSGSRLESTLNRLSNETNTSFHWHNFVDLRPLTKEEAKPKTLSNFTGRKAQPPHTDEAYVPEPARFIALTCISSGEFQCPTEVWTMSLDRTIIELEERNLLRGWTAKGYQVPQFYCNVIDTWKDNWRVRFDRICMKPPWKVASSADDAERILLEYAKKSTFVWSKGSTLIMDNWRCLHRRGDGGDIATSRVLRRWKLGGL